MEYSVDRLVRPGPTPWGRRAFRAVAFQRAPGFGAVSAVCSGHERDFPVVGASGRHPPCLSGLVSEGVSEGMHKAHVDYECGRTGAILTGFRSTPSNPTRSAATGCRTWRCGPWSESTWTTWSGDTNEGRRSCGRVCVTAGSTNGPPEVAQAVDQ